MDTLTRFINGHAVDPSWVAKKMRKTRFASNKNKPGNEYPAVAYVVEPEVEPETNG